MFKHESVVLCSVCMTLTHVCHLHIQIPLLSLCDSCTHLLSSTYLQPTPYKPTLNWEKVLVYLFLTSVVECPRFTSMYSHIPTHSRISSYTDVPCHTYVGTCVCMVLPARDVSSNHIPRQRCTCVCMDVPDCDVYI